MEFYVTDACIGCGLCTTLDPETFTMTEAGVAEVFAQPAEAALALAAETPCPANAIHHRDLRDGTRRSSGGSCRAGGDAESPLCAGGQSA